MSLDIRVLSAADVHVLANVAPGTFDDPIDTGRAEEFLRDHRHHIVVGIDGETVVGFVSAVHYVHPDKPCPEMWINEVSVAFSHRRQGLATRLIRRMLDVARELGCSEAWVSADRGNVAATRLYSSLGSDVRARDSRLFTFDLEEEDSNRQ